MRRTALCRYPRFKANRAHAAISEPWRIRETRKPNLVPIVVERYDGTSDGLRIAEMQSILWSSESCFFLEVRQADDLYGNLLIWSSYSITKAV